MHPTTDRTKSVWPCQENTPREGDRYMPFGTCGAVMYKNSAVCYAAWEVKGDQRLL